MKYKISVTINCKQLPTPKRTLIFHLEADNFSEAEDLAEAIIRENKWTDLWCGVENITIEQLTTDIIEYKKSTIKYEGLLQRKTESRAGWDIPMMNDIILIPQEIVKYNTGVRFPNGLNNHFMIITIRSSYQTSGLSIPASGIGIIDDDYRDYVFLTIKNDSDNIIHIKKGDRIAQLIPIKNIDSNLVNLENGRE